MRVKKGTRQLATDDRPTPLDVKTGSPCQASARDWGLRVVLTAELPPSEARLCFGLVLFAMALTPTNEAKLTTSSPDGLAEPTSPYESQAKIGPDDDREQSAPSNGIARAVGRDSSSGDAAHSYSPGSVNDQYARMILKLFQQSLYWIPSTSAVTLVRLVRASSERCGCNGLTAAEKWISPQAITGYQSHSARVP
ncbi:hypothetical protein CPLU01_07232 [Colletotrichum plurivorum]|uniref:Uncharacterized protein n=1 Tax=Colletotrichum plurivorum TaxID=2175906 RepID=A0A8H6KFJ5_9PEZI|nr:hypothetical protein CPLU01_07232 [Colletotrichum plurivorum]